MSSTRVWRPGARTGALQCRHSEPLFLPHPACNNQQRDLTLPSKYIPDLSVPTRPKPPSSLALMVAMPSNWFLLLHLPHTFQSWDWQACLQGARLLGACIFVTATPLLSQCESSTDNRKINEHLYLLCLHTSTFQKKFTETLKIQFHVISTCHEILIFIFFVNHLEMKKTFLAHALCKNMQQARMILLNRVSSYYASTQNL